jgi:hypothetical protein
MKTIVVGFSSPKKFKIGAYLIKWWINKPYSHVYINWTDSQDRDVVWQASNGCVHTILKQNFIKENNIVKEITLEITEEEYEKLRDFCYEHSGSVYSHSDLVTIVIYDLAIRLGLKPVFENVKGFICSELVAKMLATVFEAFLPKPDYLMRPDDVENLFNEF